MANLEATIASGGTTSNAVTIDGDRLLLGVIIPALTTSTAVKFMVSASKSGTYVSLYESDGTEVSVTASTSAERAVAVDPALFAAWNFVKCVVADAQSGTKDILVVVR